MTRSLLTASDYPLSFTRPPMRFNRTAPSYRFSLLSRLPLLEHGEHIGCPRLARDLPRGEPTRRRVWPRSRLEERRRANR